LFARALQVFPENSLTSEAFVLLMNYLRMLLVIMEREKVVTRTTSLIFFASYSQLETLYVPVEYIRRAVEHAHWEDEEVPAATVSEYVEEYIAGNKPFASPMGCNINAQQYQVTKRAAVLGVEVEDATFIDCDLFLAKLAGFYEDFLEGRQRKFNAAFHKYDIDGDGHISYSEFKLLVADLHDCEKQPISAEQMESMYDTLNAQGDGTIDYNDLMAMLSAMHRKEKAKHDLPSNLELQSLSEEEAEAQLRELTVGWNSARQTTLPAEEPGEERKAFFKARLEVIVKIQVVWAYRLKRMRGNRKTGISAAALLGF